MPDNPAAVLEVSGLKKYFPVRRGLLRRTVGHVHAVDDVSFTIGPAETVGLVGESGCGKTTVGRTILRLIEPTAGSIRLEGQELSSLSKAQLRPLRQRMQIIFQDPFSSLNPRMRAGDIVAEPLKLHADDGKRARRERVAELFERVGLRRDAMTIDSSRSSTSRAAHRTLPSRTDRRRCPSGSTGAADSPRRVMPMAGSTSGRFPK